MPAQFNANLIKWLKVALFVQPGIEKWLNTDQFYREFLASPVGWQCSPAQFRRTIRRMGYDVIGRTVNVSIESRYNGTFPSDRYITAKGVSHGISISQEPVQQADTGTANVDSDPALGASLQELRRTK